MDQERLSASAVLSIAAGKYRNDCLDWSHCARKKSVVSYEDSLKINRSKYSAFQEAARATGLLKSEDFINEVLDDAASVINLTDEERLERIL
ncbi:hypothetical protein TNCV_4190321 [Trichonephila clavipes]|nr:hypothetical protein TNCV_4190321 [Trichonephila clavipes]